MRLSGLPSVSKKISCVFLLCGLFLCYLVVSVRNTTGNMAVAQKETIPRSGMRTFPRGQIEPVPLGQNDAFHRGQDGILPLEQMNRLTQKQMDTFSKGLLNTSRQTEISTLPNEQVNTLTREQGFILSPKPMETSSREQISMLSQRQIDSSSQGQIDNSSQRQMFNFSESDIATLSKVLAGLSSQRQIDKSSQRIIETAPQKQSETPSQRQLDTFPQRLLGPLPKRLIDIASQEKLETLPKSQVDTSPHRLIDMLSQGQVDQPPQSQVGTSPQRLIDMLSQGQVDQPPQSQVGTSPQRLIDMLSQGQVDQPPGSKVDTSPQRLIDTLSQGQVDQPPQSQVGTSPQRLMDMLSQGQVNQPPQSQVGTLPQRLIDMLSQGQVDQPPQSQVGTSPQRLIDTLSQGQVDQPPQSQVGTSPQRLMDMLSQGQVNQPPQRQVDTSSQRQDDAPPQRQMEKYSRPNAPPQRCTAVTPEDILQIKLPPFLKEYKNPCWTVQQPGEGAPPIRCMPYFFLAGVPKSGTSDLYSRLIQHPQISSMAKKEIHWFTRRRWAPKDKDSAAQYPMFSNYTDFLIPADKDLFTSVDAKGYHGKIFGDSSVSTLWDNTGAFRLSKETNTRVPRTAECIHHLNPRTKFISTIRNPVDRAYSDYLYFGNYEKSQALFHEGVVKNIEFTTSCLKRFSLDFCIDYESHVRLYIGFYSFHFREFFKYFPKDQFIILKLEDYSSHMPNSLVKIFDFLGLDPLSSQAMSHVSDQSTIVNTRPASGVKLGDMWPETRKLLTDFFRPFNEELGKLLGQYYNYNQT